MALRGTPCLFVSLCFSVGLRVDSAGLRVDFVGLRGTPCHSVWTPCHPVPCHSVRTTPFPWDSVRPRVTPWDSVWHARLCADTMWTQWDSVGLCVDSVGLRGTLCGLSGTLWDSVDLVNTRLSTGTQWKPNEAQPEIPPSVL